MRKQGSNELDNNYGGSRWPESKNKQDLSKENRPRLDPMRSVLIYILILNLITSLVLVSTVFFLLISRSPFLRGFFLFYTIFFFHLHPPRVDQVTGVDPCPISTFLKSLGVAIRQKITVQASLPH